MKWARIFPMMTGLNKRHDLIVPTSVHVADSTAVHPSSSTTHLIFRRQSAYFTTNHSGKHCKYFEGRLLERGSRSRESRPPALILCDWGMKRRRSSPLPGVGMAAPS